MLLRKQANKCDFVSSLDDMIRDQIVIGINREDTRKRLLANPKLTLQRTIDTLVIKEQIETDTSCFNNTRLYQSALLRINRENQPSQNR